MKMFHVLCTLMIIYSFGFVRSESPRKNGQHLKYARTTEAVGALTDNNEGDVFRLLLNVPFKNATPPGLVVNKVVNKGNHSGVQKLNATEAEPLPVPEAIKWRWNDRTEDSRWRIPDPIINYNQMRRAPSKVIDDEIAYIMPQDFPENDDFYRYQHSKTKSPTPRRRYQNNRQRFPPDEDVYSLYSAGRPYRQRSRTRPRVAAYSTPKDKGDTIISSLLNTGSELLKVFNPFNFFSSSESEEPPPRFHYRERDVSGYPYSNAYEEEVPKKEKYRAPSYFLPERRRPYDDDETDVDDNYENLKISSPKFRSRERNEFSPDFTRDDSLVDLDFETDRRAYRRKTSSPRLQDNYAPRNSINYGNERDAIRRKYPSYDRNYDFIFGEERRSNAGKYSNEIFQNIDDRHTLDYLKEFPLRNDLYVAKDGNIYFKETKKQKIDLLGRDMYGMEYPEYAQESKHYSQLREASRRMPPVLVKSSRSSARKSGREMDDKNTNIGIVDRFGNEEFIKEKENKKPDHPHSNFALKKLAPISF